MALVFGRWCVAEELPWMGLRGAGWLEQAWTWWRPWPWACKRQAWRALKADGPSVWPVMFSGRVALDGLAGGEIGFGKACGSMVFGRWCLAEELPWMGLRGASLLEQAWTWWRPWPWQTRFHTSGGPRRRPCLGQGRGRRIYIYILYPQIIYNISYITYHNPSMEGPKQLLTLSCTPSATSTRSPLASWTSERWGAGCGL